MRHFKFMERRPRVNKIRIEWVVLPYSESYSEETKCIEVKINPFCNQETINPITFENEYESTIILQSFLFTNIPAQSTSYMRPLSFGRCLQSKTEIFTCQRCEGAKYRLRRG